MKREHKKDTMERECERMQVNVRNKNPWKTVEMGEHEKGSVGDEIDVKRGNETSNDNKR
jgi:hypothetical protein